MVSAHVNKWLSRRDWYFTAPPPNSFHLALHHSYRGARRTINRTSATAWLAEVGGRGHWEDLIQEVLMSQKYWLPGKCCHPPAIPFLHDCCRNQSKNIYWTLTMPRHSVEYIRVKIYPLQLRGGKRKFNSAFFIIDVIPFPVLLAKNGIRSWCYERNISFFWLET